MRNDLKDALHEYRRDAIATSITVGILSPMIHQVTAFTWPEAIGVVLAPLGVMLGVKLVIDGWFGPAELDPVEAELVDVHVDRRGRLHGSWRPRPKG